MYERDVAFALVLERPQPHRQYGDESSRNYHVRLDADVWLWVLAVGGSWQQLLRVSDRARTLAHADLLVETLQRGGRRCG